MARKAVPRFTQRQGEYLSFIQQYLEVNGRHPAEADIASYFGISSPAVHQMILNLERGGLLSRTSGKSRSIRVLVDRAQLPSLHGTVKHGFSAETERITEESASIEAAVAVATDVIVRQFEHLNNFPLDDSEFAPLVRCLVEGIESVLESVGVRKAAASKASNQVLEHALRIYTELCTRNDPAGADPEEDAEVFRYLMVHGRWPGS